MYEKLLRDSIKGTRRERELREIGPLAFDSLG